MASRYTLVHPADIAVTVSPKTMLLIRLTSAEIFRILELGISFDGQVATNEPVLVELCSTDGTTGGTPGSTPGTFQMGGPARAFIGEGEVDFSVEPTVMDVIKHWKIRPDGGLVIIQSPLGREVEQFRGSGNGLALRASAAEAVSFTGYMEVEQG